MMNIPPSALQENVPVRLAWWRLLLTTFVGQRCAIYIISTELTFCGVPGRHGKEEPCGFGPAASEVCGIIEIAHIVSHVDESGHDLRESYSSALVVRRLGDDVCYSLNAFI